MSDSSIKTPLTFSTIEPEAGLKKAVTMLRPDIIKEVTASGLKGRGGAGFPTGLKWNFAAVEQSPEKFVICNADEGEPGTFKDRVILGDFADLVFEGMTIGGRAIGAKEGIVYLRAEYTYLRPHLEQVLAARRAAGLLGNNVAGLDGFDFDIRVQTGAGAYVCGEETALIESLEGFRGEPRNRPPFPVNTGFLGRPSTVNNVETLANVACILARGAEWFKQKGTQASTGTKIFSVSGDCKEPGVYEFPLGISVRALLKAVGGEDAKAVQIGGASGTCIGRPQFDETIIAFEGVPTGGSIMIFGAQRDLLDVAQDFLEFFVDESCGQCTPCRCGNVQLLHGVEAMRAGRCNTDHLQDLLSLCETMQVASKCGLGQSSPNAFMSIVKNFGDEVMGRVAATSEPARN
ncbi:MAG: NADH-quinone oxidoreductase subunit F [Thermoleophilia bacterium]